jgi:Fe-S oxidoreductase
MCRCTSACPANITGRIVPRKIMMDTRDRMEEVGEILMLMFFIPDGKSLLNDYITPEELWACTLVMHV